MIRNVVVGVVRAGVPPEQVEASLEALRDCRLDGVVPGAGGIVAGQDVGLRELVAPISESVRRIQFRLT